MNRQSDCELIDTRENVYGFTHSLCVTHHKWFCHEFNLHCVPFQFEYMKYLTCDECDSEVDEGLSVPTPTLEEETEKLRKIGYLDVE